MSFPATIQPYLGPVNDPSAVNIILPAVGTPGVFAPFAPGQLGDAFTFGNNRWRFVIVDAGASALTVGQVLFWKSRALRSVTNVVADAENGGVTHAWRNSVAGISPIALTPSTIAGNLICVIVQGYGVTVKASAGTQGQILIADVAANVGQAVGMALAAAPTTDAGFLPIGVVTTNTASTVCIANVNLQFFP